MRIKRHFLATVALALVMIVASGCARPPAPPAPKPPQTIEQLRAAIADVLKSTHTPGCGFALVNRDSVIYAGGVGKADLAANRNVTADTMFRIGSITKSFVALSMLKIRRRARLTCTRRLPTSRPK